MITKREYFIGCVAEECEEVAQRAMKAIRFGLFEERPAEHGGDGLNNWQALCKEWEDLLVSFQVLMEQEGLIFTLTDEAIIKKRAKIIRFLEYAQEVGQVEK